MSITGTFTVQLLHEGIPPHKVTFYMEDGQLKGTYENEHGSQQATDISTAQKGREVSFTCMNGMNNDEEFRFTMNYDGTNFVGGAINKTNAEKGVCPASGKKIG